MFEKAAITVPRPGCGEKTEKAVAWLKSNDQLVCPACGKTIDVEAEDLLAGLKRAEKSVADLRKSLRRRK